MPNKLSITVSDEMMKRIDDYRFGNRIDKKQTAVIDILEFGLRVMEDNHTKGKADGTNESHVQEILQQDE